jgi:glycosyl-4,4'-diaponeurosporenoate acyltransferase
MVALLRPESLYEALGVKFFKRYLLPTEHLVRHSLGGKALRGDQVHLRADLERLLWETKRNETIHVLGFILFGVVLLVKSKDISIVEWFVFVAVNLYVNVYPILLQRYNRIRLNRLLKRCTP